jgi:glycerophosphoryl diester phosphodiesterase
LGGAALANREHMKIFVFMRELIFVTLGMLTLPMQGVEFISHRGESIEAPENTMAAFKLAWAKNSDSIELDIHRTADGKIVVCHDTTTKRTTGTEGKLSEMTLANIQRLDAGSFKDPRFIGEKMPELAQVLEAMPHGRCFIEIKSGEDVVPALAEYLKNSSIPKNRLALISFNEKALKHAHDLLPDLKSYLVASMRKDKETGVIKPSLDSLIASARKNGFHGLDLGFSPLIDAETVKKVKSEGLEFYVWTVNKTADAQTAMSIGVDGITSDRAAALKVELTGGSTTPSPAQN